MRNNYYSEFAKNIAASGISYAFGVTGSGASLQLISAIEKLNIPFYPVAHEAAAALMAGACCRDGCARAIAIGIKGPGFINFMPGILANYYEGRPALTISEAYSPSDPAFKKHKRLDHFSVCSSVVKAYARANTSLDSIHSLFNLAVKEFPGPIHIDMCNEPVEGENVPYNIEEMSTQVSKSQVGEILALIRRSSRPVVILGSAMSRLSSGVNWKELAVPVVTTAAAKGCIDEFSPYASGVFTGEGKEISPEEMVISKSDLIIAFALRNVEVTRVKKFNVPTVMLDVIDGDMQDGFAASLSVAVKDFGHIVEPVFADLLKKEWGLECVQEYWKSVNAELPENQWLPSVMFRALERAGLKDPLLVLDTGLFCIIGEILWRAQHPRNFCGSSNGRFMGTAIPTAIGAAISSPMQDVICVAGDGGVRPYFPEIRLAVELNLPLIFILMSDGQYGTVASSVKDHSFPNSAFTIKSPSWRHVVEAMGCSSVKVNDLNEFEDILSQWSVQRRPLFIESSFEAEKYINMVKRLR